MVQPAENQAELDAVPIRDNREPLVDFLALCPELRFAGRHPVFEFPRVHLLRRSVAEKLREAAHELPDGLYLSIVEGYRPLQVQRAMFRHAIRRARELYPDWNGEQVLAEAGRYSAPTDAKSPPPHLTGGAVDLAIVDENDVHLDMHSPYKIEDLGHAAFDAPGISDTARRNRELLRSVLEPTGLTNYADEWWHWSYGDNGWALRVGAPFALYDRIEMPPDAHWIGNMSKLPRE